MTVLDLYAGPGGWDLAASSLGIDPIGIELDSDTCATRTAVGHRSIQADAEDFHLPNTVALDGLIASPPCPAFSAAGNGTGRAELPELCDLLDYEDGAWLPDGFSVDARLLIQPVRFIAAHHPRWVAMEQVPPVLPFWVAMARWMQRTMGYRTWTGILDAADYGVPQNRHRAFLIAHRDHPVGPPAATHLRPPEQAWLFPPELPTWITMAEALGMPYTTEVDTGQNTVMANGSIERYRRSTNRPAATVIGNSCRAWTLNQYDERTNDHGDPYRPPRTLDDPAPTITSKVNRWEWKLDPREMSKPLRSLDLPAQTLTGSALGNWVFRRPGHKINQDDIDRLGETKARARYGGLAGSDAIKIEPWQAGVLQSFPPDYPWQGSKTSQARQIGNAVPPMLARRVLEQVTA